VVEKLSCVRENERNFPAPLLVILVQTIGSERPGVTTSDRQADARATGLSALDDLLGILFIIHFY
jgi:hypothetical protein